MVLLTAGGTRVHAPAVQWTASAQNVIPYRRYHWYGDG